MSMAIKDYPEGNINITSPLNTYFICIWFNSFVLVRQWHRKQKRLEEHHFFRKKGSLMPIEVCTF